MNQNLNSQDQSSPESQSAGIHSPSSKKSNIGQAVAIIVVAIALVEVIAFAALTFAVHFGSGQEESGQNNLSKEKTVLTKENYRVASKAVDVFVEEYNGIISNLENPVKFNTLLSTAEYKSRAEKLKQIKNSISDKFIQLEKTKALTKDKDLKALCEKVKKQLTNLFNALDLLIELNGDVMSEIARISEIENDSSLEDAIVVMKKISSALANFSSKSKFGITREFTKKMSTFYDEMAKLFNNERASRANSLKQDEVEEDARATTEAFARAVDEILAKVETKGDINALNRAIKKANKQAQGE